MNVVVKLFCSSCSQELFQSKIDARIIEAICLNHHCSDYDKCLKLNIKVSEFDLDDISYDHAMIGQTRSGILLSATEQFVPGHWHPMK